WYTSCSITDNTRKSTASSYLEPISHDNPPSDLAEITVAVTGNATNQSALHDHNAPGANNQPPVPTITSEIDPYDTLGYEQCHNYSVLRENERYDDLLNGIRTGTVKYERLADRVYSPPYQQVNAVSNGNGNQSNKTKREVSLAIMLCCSITSLVLNCPVGVFSVCYAYMAKTERFYPMRRYYKYVSFWNFCYTS
ncbi:uncharacterized protein LOC134249177, partial [Saccostrea cucullata]|uniref:uncharacterized protein LOC134249177 n=1 Tax=Saccostrea cuccullata TaxID=36930 RepID=UPI002ED24322